MDDKLVTIAEYDQEFEAQFARNMLADNGIKAVVVGGNVKGLFPADGLVGFRQHLSQNLIFFVEFFNVCWEFIRIGKARGFHKISQCCAAAVFGQFVFNTVDLFLQHIRRLTDHRDLFEQWLWARFLAGQAAGAFDALNSQFALGALHALHRTVR